MSVLFFFFFPAKVLLPKQFASIVSVSVIFSFVFYVDFLVELGVRVHLSKETRSHYVICS